MTPFEIWFRETYKFDPNFPETDVDELACRVAKQAWYAGLKHGIEETNEMLKKLMPKHF